MSLHLEFQWTGHWATGTHGHSYKADLAESLVATCSSWPALVLPKGCSIHIEEWAWRGWFFARQYLNLPVLQKHEHYTFADLFLAGAF